ncbi:MAG: hypothetical protein LBD12_03280, partial [Clostridiales Family XIII bacterium]|nr:hypothetical protein [Clostridiales Family XIII bacterium]
ASVDTLVGTSATGGLYARNTYDYSYVYGERGRYFGDFVTENNTKKERSIPFYPNGNLGGQKTSQNPWEADSGAKNAIRLQVPFLLGYDGGKSAPVTKQWIHRKADGTYSEYMLDLSFVRATDLAKAAGASANGQVGTDWVDTDGLTAVAFAAEAVKAIENVLPPSAPKTFAKAPAPVVTGTAKVGKTLRAKAGSWDVGTKLTWQWYVGGKAVKGATKSTFKPKASDYGKKITVKVTAKKAGYKTAVKTSKSTKKVAR